MAGQFPRSAPFRDHSGNPVGSYGDREGSKRWGEYKTDDPLAHGGFGRTDGFSKYRTNVNLCNPIPERADFNAGEGFMLPSAMVKYDMTKETHAAHNHRRRFEMNKITEVFPLNDPERKNELGSHVLTASTREGLDSNTRRFYQSTRNQRIYLDHTAEIRRKVAEKIRRKRIEELKAAVRLKAFLNPTPETLAHYRHICSIEYDLDSYYEDEKEEIIKAEGDNEVESGKESDVPVRVENSAAMSPQGDVLGLQTHSLLNNGFREQNLPSITGPQNLESTNQPQSLSPEPNALKGILKTPQHETNQFVRPWTDPKMAMQVSCWKPYNRCNQRPSRRVRFKDEVFGSLDDSPGYIQVPPPHITSFFPAFRDKNAREFEEPDALYYDPELCTNVPSKLGLQFKSEACKRFHQRYPDAVPDLRDFRIYPKKHFFYNGYHTSVLRG